MPWRLRPRRCRTACRGPRWWACAGHCPRGCVRPAVAAPPYPDGAENRLESTARVFALVRQGDPLIGDHLDRLLPFCLEVEPVLHQEPEKLIAIGPKVLLDFEVGHPVCALVLHLRDHLLELHGRRTKGFHFGLGNAILLHEGVSFCTYVGQHFIRTLGGALVNGESTLSHRNYVVLKDLHPTQKKR